MRRHSVWIVVWVFGGLWSAATLGACSKENNVSSDTNVGSCSSVPAGTCPEGLSPEISSEGSIQACEQDGEGMCKQVGSCTVRCVDPRGCTAQGSVCGSDQHPACCGETAGTHSCVGFLDDEVVVCSARCSKSSDCPDTCCDATINGGTFAVCAPREVCARAQIPSACLACIEQMCPDDLAACQADETCSACMAGEKYVNSPECRDNEVLKVGYGCGVRECPDECRM